MKLVTTLQSHKIVSVKSNSQDVNGPFSVKIVNTFAEISLKSSISQTESKQADDGFSIKLLRDYGQNIRTIL